MSMKLSGSWSTRGAIIARNVIARIILYSERLAAEVSEGDEREV